MRDLEKIMSSCCNYCKWFCPSGFGPWDEPLGVCEYSRMMNKINGTPSKYVVFYTEACVCGYEHTIHNHFNIPYQEYAREYEKAISIRQKLKWDIYNMKHLRGPVYSEKQRIGNFFDK